MLLLLIPLSYGATIEDWDINIAINNDNTADWTVNIKYEKPVQTSNYYVLSSVRNIQVTADDQRIICTSEILDVGTSIVCDETNASKFVYKFRASDMISILRNFNTLDYRFNIPITTDRYSVKIELPIGAALVDESKLKSTGLKPFEPFWNEVNKTVERGSDGRTIFISWSIINPRLGEEFDTTIIYEIFDTTSQLNVLVIIAGIVIVIITILFMIRRKDFRQILPILTESERKVMEILIREKKSVDQKTIVKELDYSKPKVSRIVKDLQKRNLIEVERRGRKNLLNLKKTTDKEPQDKKEE